MVLCSFTCLSTQPPPVFAARFIKMCFYACIYPEKVDPACLQSPEQQGVESVAWGNFILSFSCSLWDFKPATSRAHGSNLQASVVKSDLKKLLAGFGSVQQQHLNGTRFFFFCDRSCEICSTCERQQSAWSTFQYFRVTKWWVARRCSRAAWVRERDRQLVAESDLEGYKAQVGCLPVFHSYSLSNTQTHTTWLHTLSYARTHTPTHLPDKRRSPHTQPPTDSHT